MDPAPRNRGGNCMWTRTMRAQRLRPQRPQTWRRGRIRLPEKQRGWNTRAMTSWFRKEHVTVPNSYIDDVVHYVSASVPIRATRQQVWDFIKPAENAVLFDPDIVRGFSAPGPSGVGQIQVFLSVREGVESVSAVELIEEIPLELAITRQIGSQDPSAKGRDFLRETDIGTILEHGRYFSLPLHAHGHLREYEQHYRSFCQQYIVRVKAILEGIPAASADGPRRFN